MATDAIAASHCDPGWRWGRQAATLALPGTRHDPPASRLTASQDAAAAYPEREGAVVGGGNSSSTAFRFRATPTAAAAASDAQAKPPMPPMLSGHNHAPAGRRDVLSNLLDIGAAAHHHRHRQAAAQSSRKAKASSYPVLPTTLPPTPLFGKTVESAHDVVAALTPRQDFVHGPPAPAVRAKRAGVEVSLFTAPHVPSAPPSPAPAPLSSSTLIPPAQPQDVGKLVVVLDLDETLVYSRDVTVYERPGVIQLLKALKGRCEVIVWTAGTREYALDVIRVIDPVCAVQHCIYRHPMWWNGDTGCTKDLRMLGRPMDRVLLIDNTPSVFRANPRNSLLVEDFVVPNSRSYNAQERTLTVLTGIFEHVFRRFTSPCAADVLASKRIVRQIVRLERGICVELNVLTIGCNLDVEWCVSSRTARQRLTT